MLLMIIDREHWEHLDYFGMKKSLM